MTLTEAGPLYAHDFLTDRETTMLIILGDDMILIVWGFLLAAPRFISQIVPE